jgi:hypothetical protein
MTSHILLAALAIAAIAPQALAQSTPALAAATSDALAPRVIRVPEGRPTPVLLDGQLSPGEWADALAVPVSGSIRLLVKQTGGYVFIAVATASRVPRPIDIFLEDAAGALHQLHASMAIGERALADTLWGEGDRPAWRWGNHVDWMANEAKTDSQRPTTLPFSARLFPADGTEYQIRRSRIPGARWRIRVDVGAFPGTEGTHTFPSGAGRAPSSWAVVELD